MIKSIISKVISKETIHRLLGDVKIIITNPLTENGIYYVHDDEDFMKGYAMIMGPSDTPYFGGYFFFELTYPCDYPHSPPKVTYHTNGDNIRFNPNLYKCGKVCISMLNTWRGEQWTSCQTISTVLLTLCTLLCKDPLLNEPGITNNHLEFQKYTDIIEYKSLDVACLQMLQRKSSVFLNKFHIFYPNMKEEFAKNADLIGNILEKKKEMPAEVLTTGIYSMKVSINYAELYTLFLETKKMTLSEKNEINK